jgi:hypothetical protein
VVAALFPRLAKWVVAASGMELGLRFVCAAWACGLVVWSAGQWSLDLSGEWDLAMGLCMSLVCTHVHSGSAPHAVQHSAAVEAVRLPMSCPFVRVLLRIEHCCCCCCCDTPAVTPLIIIAITIKFALDLCIAVIPLL